jgi:hypothetical protein
VSNLIVPGCLAIGVQQNVRVPFHQARHQGCARQVYHLGPRGVDGRGRTGGFDPVSSHQYGPAVMHALAIERTRCAKYNCLGGRAGRRALRHGWQTEHR